MKVLLLADPASVHTLRWANSLSERGVEICIFGISTYDRTVYNKEIRIETLDSSPGIKARTDGSILKIVYLKAVGKIKSLIRSFNPDIVHSHYASSFGLLGALQNFHPYIISVWGADIYNFPEKSFIHKSIIRFSLGRADRILSTSRVMALKTSRYTKKNIEITPFGIDINKFRPEKNDNLFGKSLVIGTVKTLEKKYGIGYLIKAFKLLKDKFSDIKLLIVGSGSMEHELKEMVSSMGIENDVHFTGFIPSEKVSEYHKMIDIYVAASIEDSESFGVAILEAGACGKPVVVSNVGGLSEIVENGKTGLIVEKQNTKALAEGIEKLLVNINLRNEMGNNGRMKVLQEYNWADSVDKMISIYKSVL